MRKYELIHSLLIGFEMKMLITGYYYYRLFERIDANKDGKIQVSELKDLTVEFGMLGKVKCEIDELATALISDFDTDKDGEIDEVEFEKGIEKWLKQYKFSFDSTECRGENRAVST